MLVISLPPTKVLLSNIQCVCKPSMQRHFLGFCEIRGFPAALSPSSLGTWYKAVFELLLQKWENIAKELSGSSAADDVGPSVEEAIQCAKVFAALIQVTKTHTDKQVRNYLSIDK
jgi:hypothetical protein